MQNNVMNERELSERRKFEQELTAILKRCESSGALVRVFGSLAYFIHCPKHGYLQSALGRPYGDIDLASYNIYNKEIREIMTSLGYEENRKIFVLSESQRAVFYKKNDAIRVEIFFEKLDFCHVISWKDRLHVDSPTIPLAELLLEKLQIVRISEIDVINIIMLLLEHPIGETNKETINIKLVARLCAEDWGLWRTTTMNLEKVKKYIQQYNQLSSEQQVKLELQINDMLLRLYTEPKPFAWKVRDQMGDRVKWYKDVDEV